MCCRLPNMPPLVPMTKASGLVALAVMRLIPKAGKAEKVSNAPPPATALMTPALTTEPDIMAKIYCVTTST